MGLFTDLLGTTKRAFAFGPKAVRGTVDFGALTAPRTAAFPDKSGTVAMLEDVSGSAAFVDGGSFTTNLTDPRLKVDFGGFS